MRMTSERSQEGLSAGQQLYAVIEFCTDPETLWGKIKSGEWDWLGVYESKGRRRFILGRPRLSRIVVKAALTTSEGGVAPGDTKHRLEIHYPDFAVPSVSIYRTPEGARDGFAERIATLGERPGSSVLLRAKLFVNGDLEREELVVRPRPNVL